MADQVAKLVKILVTNSLTKLDTLLLSGHSMGMRRNFLLSGGIFNLKLFPGAQVAGFTRKKVSGIHAIVGLDAANPFNDEKTPSERLDSTDA